MTNWRNIPLRTAALYCSAIIVTAVEYLLVTVLNNLSSMRVNENLDINPTHYLDINHADIVARIDLTEWETNPQSTRYLTFLKGRVGRKVADFFMDFLGASEGLNAKAQNRGLLQAVDDFTAEAQLDKAERQNVRQQVYSYCNEQLQAGEEIELESLSKELSGVSEVSFSEFTAEKGYELEESFPADRSTLRQLTKYAGSGGGLTINFDAMLLGERIFWGRRPIPDYQRDAAESARPVAATHVGREIKAYDIKDAVVSKGIRQKPPVNFSLFRQILYAHIVAFLMMLVLGMVFTVLSLVLFYTYGPTGY